jgi:hypothetical protein
VEGAERINPALGIARKDTLICSCIEFQGCLKARSKVSQQGNSRVSQSTNTQIAKTVVKNWQNANALGNTSVSNKSWRKPAGRQDAVTRGRRREREASITKMGKE